MAVSRIGPSMPAPTTSESGTSDPGDGGNSAPVALIVVTAIVSALLCLCVVVLVLRNNRRRQILMSAETSGDTNPGPAILWKSLEGHEEEDGGNEAAGRRRSAQREEQLVVMAGEDLPTFLAHPVGAPPTAACSNIHIECPPLHL